MRKVLAILPIVVGAGSAVAQNGVPHWEAFSPAPPPYGWIDWIEPSAGPLGDGVYVGGSFLRPGTPTYEGVLFLGGGTWSLLGTGVRRLLEDGGVTCMATFDDGSGPALYVGGRFNIVDGVQSVGIARWNGSQWHTFGPGLGLGFPAQVIAMTVHDDGSGPKLYIAGDFASVGGVPAANLARWNGTTWSPVGGPNARVTALCSLHDGLSRALYAGGTFSSIGGVAAAGVARWNGAAWEPLGDGLSSGASPGRIYAFEVFDDGAGPQLYAGGNFTNSGPTQLRWIARWNGAQWLDVGGGISNGASSGFVEQLLSFDDGLGPALYACGAISQAGGRPARGIARYRNGAWSDVAGSADGSAYALNIQGQGPTRRLLVGGSFSSLGGTETPSLGAWTSCPSCYPNCDASSIAPTLNIHDFICFLNRFAAGDPYANCDHSTTAPVLNIQDFSCFLNQFAAGCP